MACLKAVKLFNKTPSNATSMFFLLPIIRSNLVNNDLILQTISLKTFVHFQAWNNLET
jgi:hypothetical protein